MIGYRPDTTTPGIFFSSSNISSLHAFYVADWVGDSDDYISTNVHHNHPIFWSARKQKSVPRSSIEAEYMSAANNASKL